MSVFPMFNIDNLYQDNIPVNTKKNKIYRINVKINQIADAFEP